MPQLMPDPQRDFPRTIWKHFLITIAVFIVITLISKACSAQYDPDANDTTWVKIRSIAFNHTVDEWVKRGSDAAKMYAAQLPHDTIYINIDSARIAKDILMDSIRRDWVKDSLSYMTRFGVFTMDTISFGGGGMVLDGFSSMKHHISVRRRSTKHKGKRKPPLPVVWDRTESGGTTTVSRNGRVDTVRGWVVFTNWKSDRADGNTSAIGYWVGSGGMRIVFTEQGLIMSYTMHQIGKNFSKEENGSFYLANGTKVRNYRVYGLRYFKLQE